jgi:transposase
LKRLSEKEKKALARMEAIIKVRSGQMTATEAAEQLGVSRKTWYEWENRGLKAMAEALTDKESGRPRKESDPEKDALMKELIEVKKENILLQEGLEINRIMNQAHQQAPQPSTPTRGPGSKKNSMKRKRKRRKKS